uniref:Uncharacterized protein n=1 Tax=Globisporangium ultimum (strain ATCC 200006 / CBS 805.95 / DAOM BR144) TaxID=431595 RepID=K3WF05_GLOUD
MYMDKLPDMTAYFHDSWKTSAFVDAYSELSENAILPLVLKEALTSERAAKEEEDFIPISYRDSGGSTYLKMWNLQANWPQ